MKKMWCADKRLPCALADLSMKLREWNRVTFGNIFRRKKRNELCLGGVQRAMERGVTGHLLTLEKELREEWCIILLQEEMLWLQKSRHAWLKLGDGNTRYFHTSTLIKRRRNRIEALMDEGDRRVDKKEELKIMAVNFYANLFNSTGEHNAVLTRGCFSNMEQK